jgi:arabinofuranosyltransferase
MVLAARTRTPPSPPSPVRRARWAERGLLAFPAVGIVLAGWEHRFVTDDGFIYLRVVRQILAGNGPVFNAGERVEAFTSPAWLALLTVADVATPLTLERIAVGLGVVSTGIGFALASFGAARLRRVAGGGAFMVPAGVLVPLVVAPMWYFTTSGLETGLIFAWLGASLWLLTSWARGRAPLAPWAAVVLGLGWLVRPDLLVLSVAFGVAVVAADWRASGPRDRWRVIGWMVALPALYQLFRMGYYGVLVPNTAIAKEASQTRWEEGWDYLHAFGRTYWLWLPLLALVVGAYVPLVARLRAAGANRGLAVAAAFATGGVLHALYVVRVGGDYFPARLLLPSLFAVCTPVAAVAWERRSALAFVVVAWAVACALWLRPPYGFGGSTELPITASARGWAPGGRFHEWFRVPAAYHEFQRLPGPAPRSLQLPTIAIGGIGLVGFGMGPDVDVLDRLGLADPVTAHFELTRRGLAGHEKPMPGPWAAARLTAPGAPTPATRFRPSGLVAPLIPPTEGRAFDEQVEWARAALECPDVRRLRESTRGELTVGRFVSNVVGSFGRTRFRIPPDPKAAYRELCGPGRPPGTGAG